MIFSKPNYKFYLYLRLKQFPNYSDLAFFNYHSKRPLPNEILHYLLVPELTFLRRYQEDYALMDQVLESQLC